MLLSIESSCDDSSIALTEIESRRLVLHKKISQEAEHARYGGVVPELASRLHAVDLPRLLESARPYFNDIKAVAVTNEPGLAVTLNEGVMMAKAFAAFQKLPLVPVHHLKGHIYSLFIEKPTRLPMIVILVSGGHTMILRVKGLEDMEILATSLDDSVGESYDKVAKMMGLGYPGGPIIEALAREGDENRFELPVPLRNSPLIAFSLSGLKNAVRLVIQELGGPEGMSEQDRRDLAASFQKALIAHLIQKSRKLLAKEAIPDVALVGGASANLAIRGAVEALCAQYGKRIHTAPLEFCSDNAAMIGRYGLDALAAGLTVAPEDLRVNPSRKLKAGMKL
ncbi:tRNA (adenosine(37)-N6)-threonylcarbamoyltransferase complex transferase subunit TsaD [Nitratifractor salsuginis]|uniref:tRNA N6-adenosine threonylcarbamoyltransferase n=1 Tax=Nitratifractor salsuginis (strain DSM 16511 / JCM 12458 / E9I37-1) TaxID=749222 RepID=E6WZ50_NITSE|nr:tRNA (adenosine(37)-N6)-threonylcarbamoyltransferase complex transferase subunit TsaD [Nitratifractor salsuginis]ADV45500.1 O-sialoglycoprotein endopeptidase [Nitratifractor salsuginis DSM 16511]